MEETDYKYFRKKLLLSSLLPFFLVTIMWLVKITESVFGLDFTGGGIYPLSSEGLPGIIFSPFIHDDFKHIFNNSIPLFFLLVALFYFYPDQAIRIFLLTYLFTGLLLWFFGRPAWHIGASGLVYGIASFHFFSGIVRKYFRLIALSLLIVFLYGSMVWGLFPEFYRNVSWEGHMFGFVSGVVLALVYRNEGPTPPSYAWMDEDDEVENESKADAGKFPDKE